MRIEFVALFAIVVIAVLGLSIFYINPVIPTQNQIKKFSSYEELKSFLKAKLEESSYYGDFLGSRTAGIQTTTPTAESAKGTAGEDYSTTNIQVAGVDEADIVKNDGKYIYTVTGNKVVILNAFPAEEAKILSTLEFNGSVAGIFINEDKLVVFGNLPTYYGYPVAESAPSVKCAGDRGCIVPPIRYMPKAFAYVYDIADRENPVLKRNVTVDGNYVNSRMIGDYVYVVANSYIDNTEDMILPTIISNGEVRQIPATDVYYFDTIDSSYLFTTILSINTQDDQQDISNKEILMGYTQNMYVSLDNIYIIYQKSFSYEEYQNRLYDKVLIPSLPIDVATQINVIRISSISENEKYEKISTILQEYSESLSDGQRTNLEESVQKKMVEFQTEMQKEMQKTVVHRIAIDSGGIEYKANGEVPGYALNQFSMDEHDGYFRIATTTRNSWWGPIGVSTRTQVLSTGTGSVETTIARQERVVSLQEEAPAQPPQSLNHVYVLDSDLKIVGRLENLAPDESIYSARFLGDRAYLVTFRRVDPLFVIDLSEPSAPKVLGQLKIPGYSDYLHPYDETHIIGIGKEVSESEGGMALMQGVKLGLFDVTDPENPKEIAKYEIGSRGTDSDALHDHKAFLFDKNKNLLVIPVLLVEGNPFEPFGYRPYTWQGAYVFETSLDNGFTLKGKITHAPSNTTHEYYYYYGPYSVKRSLYIDDVLYTVSDKMIKINSLDTLNEIKSVELPSQEIYPIGI